MAEMKNHKSGFVAVVGRPNVGKSTLINALVGQKITIMSDKPQTTRTRVLGILTHSDAQIAFLDTPGVNRPKDKLGEYMKMTTDKAVNEADVIFLVADGSGGIKLGDLYIIKRLQRFEKPVLLVLSKVDVTPKEKLLALIERYRVLYPFKEIIPISSTTGENLDTLLESVKKYLPEGPAYYPEDMVTDQPERLVIAELIREKVLYLTYKEIPYSIAVDVDEISTNQNGLVEIRSNIYVDRDSQKGILIGKEGIRLRKIGELARYDIEELLGAHVYLQLWVKVKEDWRKSAGTLSSLGYT